MNARTIGLCLVLAAGPALAAEGLTAPTAERLWPQWQARIGVQTARLSPLTMSGLLGGAGAHRGLQGASLLGDYTFATPWFGSFRASGGLLIGSQAGATLSSNSGVIGGGGGPRLGVTFSSVGTLASGTGADIGGTVPYLGLGFSGSALRNSLSITADVGMVAEHAGSAIGSGRALFGNQAADGGLRDLRLSPMLQLGVRYTF